MLSVFFPLKWGTQPSPQVALKRCWDGYTSLGPPEWQESGSGPAVLHSQSCPPLPPTFPEKGLPPRQRVWCLWAHA